MAKKTVDEIFNWYNLSKYRNVIYGFSALWIVVFHVTTTFVKLTKSFHPFIIQLIQAGNVGVDIFLVMSGICLYFSLKKTNGKHILIFYKRRFSKILKIYLLICIPWLIFWSFHKTGNLDLFISEATFTKMTGFWFIGFIGICYLIYPILFKLIENKKSYIISIFIPIYFLFLCFLSKQFNEFYSAYNIALVRLIPFLLGSILGKYVYEKRNIKQSTVLLTLLLSISYETIIVLLGKKEFFSPFLSVIKNTYFTPLALNAIFLIIIFFTLFKLPKLKKILESIGTFSLELYVVHVIIIRYATNVLGIIPSNISLYILYFIVFTPISIITSKLVYNLLNLIPPRSTKKTVSSPSSPPL